MNTIKSYSRMLFNAFALVLLFSMSAATFADEGPTNVDDDGFAIKGYDTVAYFTESKPVKGSEEYAYDWNHGKWLFSSQENLDLFKANPEKYAPQFGGYCAWAVAREGFAPIQVEQWSIVDDKLYLNFNKKIAKRWNKKRDAFIEAGHKNWPELLEEALENVEG